MTRTLLCSHPIAGDTRTGELRDYVWTLEDNGNGDMVVARALNAYGPGQQPRVTHRSVYMLGSEPYSWMPSEVLAVMLPAHEAAKRPRKQEVFGHAKRVEKLAARYAVTVEKADAIIEKHGARAEEACTLAAGSGHDPMDMVLGDAQATATATELRRREDFDALEARVEELAKATGGRFETDERMLKATNERVAKLENDTDPEHPMRVELRQLKLRVDKLEAHPPMRATVTGIKVSAVPTAGGAIGKVAGKVAGTIEGIEILRYNDDGSVLVLDTITQREATIPASAITPKRMVPRDLPAVERDPRDPRAPAVAGFDPPPFVFDRTTVFDPENGYREVVRIAPKQVGRVELEALEAWLDHVPGAARASSSS